MRLSLGAAAYAPGDPFLPSQVRRTKDFPSAMTWPVSKHGYLRRPSKWKSDPYMALPSVSLDPPLWCYRVHLQLIGSLHYTRWCCKRAQRDQEADRMDGPRGACPVRFIGCQALIALLGKVSLGAERRDIQLTPVGMWAPVTHALFITNFCSVG